MLITLFLLSFILVYNGRKKNNNIKYLGFFILFITIIIIGIKYNNDRIVYEKFLKKLPTDKMEQTIEIKVEMAFLKKLKDSSTENISSKLINYRITEINILETYDNYILAFVKYDVQPAIWAYNSYISGNGKRNKKWIINKINYLNIELNSEGDICINDINTSI